MALSSQIRTGREPWTSFSRVGANASGNPRTCSRQAIRVAYVGCETLTLDPCLAPVSPDANRTQLTPFLRTQTPFSRTQTLRRTRAVA